MATQVRDYQSWGFRSAEMYEFPNIINVEVYRGTCPCRCVHCPVGIVAPQDRQRRFGTKGVNLRLYRKIIDEVSEYPHALVRMHAVGEPLDWPEMGEALKLHNKSTKYWLFTSAVTRDTSLLEELCTRVDIIEVSVNSTTQEDYFETKGVNAFATACANIQLMRRVIDRTASGTRLIVSRVQSADTTRDGEFIQHWQMSGLVDDAFVRTYHTYNDLIDELDTAQTQTKHEPCLVHWARFNISADGYAIVCFNELFKEQLHPALILGDINKQRIAQIWQGRKLQLLRAAELSGDYASCPFESALPCKNCRFCQPLFGTSVTSDHQIKLIGR